MPITYLEDKGTIEFPNPLDTGSEDGLIAIGGNLDPSTLLNAYRKGIFPWTSKHEPLMWWIQDPRLVLFIDDLKLSASTKQVAESSIFEVTVNKEFREVIKNCQVIDRKSQDGTWITDDILNAYCKLNELDHAISFEVWQNKELVGGLYGVVIGKMFFGESMFSKVTNASKVGFVKCVQYLKEFGYDIIDCQQDTPYLRSFGAKTIDMKLFLDLVVNRIDEPNTLLKKTYLNEI